MLDGLVSSQPEHNKSTLNSRLHYMLKCLLDTSSYSKSKNRKIRIGAVNRGYLKWEHPLNRYLFSFSFEANYFET